MNQAHLHLIMNHIPVVGVPLAAILLGYGLKFKNPAVFRAALVFLAALALMALPVFLTGEPAEDLAENLPGVTEAVIEPHEDAGKVAMILSLVTGSFAALAFSFKRDEGKQILLGKVTLILACAATIALGYTANLGGKIRHTEIRNDGQ